MTSRNIRQRLLQSTMIGGAALMALVAVPAVTLLAPTTAEAQDYTTGTLSGRVAGTDGAAISGAQVAVRSTAQGVTRTVTTNANGEFRLPLIPTGAYEVTVEASGYDTVSDEVAVTLGGSSNYEFTLGVVGASNATELGDIVVTGVRRQLDLSRAATGVTVDVEQLVDQVPVARNITAVTLLAPGAVAGDSAFAVGSAQLQAPPALGGSSPAENAFFVNGLNITNFVNGLGGASVPFEFYKTVEVKTGGYSAEFGRATGGVINAVTKSGTNDFSLELHGTWAPDSLREDSPDTEGGPNNLGLVNSVSEFEEKTLTVEMGGPIIRDRLFAYGIVAWQDTEAQSATTDATRTVGTLNRDTYSDDPFYGIKLDGYITADHRLEATYFDTSRTRDRVAYNYNPTTGEVGATPLTTTTQWQGGPSWVGRYTGSFTDWLTLSAAYGESEVDQAAVNDLIDSALVQDNRLNTTPDPDNPGEFLTNGNARRSRQTVSATTTPFLAERKFYRFDADLYFDVFGQHHLRIGYDHEDTTLTEVSVRNGGGNYQYLTGTASTNTSLGIAAGQEYVTKRVFISGGGFEGANEAYYIQDSWDVTDRLNVGIGFRNDSFEIQNPVGDTFVNFKDNWAPRLSFAYDPIGDARSKFYGSYGRYFLPPASNTAFRMAAPAIDFTEYYLPAGGAQYFSSVAGGTSGLDPVTGLPSAGLGPQVSGARPSLQICPDGVGAAQPGVQACSVRNNGTAPDPDVLAAKNLEATYEDEFIIGYQTRLSDLWTVGVNAVYRNLGRAAEDALLDAGVRAYCDANGIAGCDAAFPGQSYYLIINPGEDVEANVPLPTGNQIITLKAEDLGIPKVKREYSALEFTFERGFDGVWGLQGSYTLSKSEGNYEGGVKSDIGQTDSGITQDFDFLSFIPGSYGLLPNHRAHQFKVFGSWQATQNLLVGANLSVTSPRHYGCVGLAPTSDDGGYAGDGNVANDSYGAAARFCNGLVVDRGSVFESDWTTRFDMSFRYSLDDLVPGNLVLRADIFNVFNLDSAIEMNEFGEDDGGNADPTYQAPTNYQAPRSIRIGFDWAF